MSTVDRLQDEILLALYEFRKFVALVCAFHEQPVTAEVFAEFFIEMGMHCLGCPASQAESLEDACAVHGVDPESVIKAINDKIADSGK